MVTNWLDINCQFHRSYWGKLNEKFKGQPDYRPRIEFDDEGAVINHIILDRKLGNYGTEIPVGTWHSLIVLEDGSIVYEVKDGPYLPIDDKNFAPWAPKEGMAGCVEFIEDIFTKLALE